MGRLLKQKKGKFKFFSTVTDEYLNDKYLDRSEMMEFLLEDKIWDLIMSSLNDLIFFPEGWTDKDSGKRIWSEDDSHSEYSKVISLDTESMVKEFLQRLKKEGIEFTIKTKNFSISTEE